MTRYAILTEGCRVVATARSSVHPIRAEAHRLGGFIEADISDGVIDLVNRPQATIELRLADLKAENAMYDAELKRRIDATRHPSISGTVTDVGGAADGGYSVRGDLSLHGVTSPVQGTARVTGSGQRIEVSGQLTLDIQNFGLKAPRILMLRVYPEVQVDIEFIAEAEG